MSRSKDLVIAGLACASVALVVLTWRQRMEIQRLSPVVSRPNVRSAATVTIHSAGVRNLAVVPPARANPLAADDYSSPTAEENGFPFRRSTTEPAPRKKGALAQLVENPEFMAALGVHRQATLDARFSGLFRQLNLTAEELAAFKRLLADKESVALDVVAISEASSDGPLRPATLRASVQTAQAQVEDAIRTSLGGERYELYRDYERTLVHRVTVAQLEQRLSYSGTPLTPAQADSLVRILATNASREPAVQAPAISVVVAAGNQAILPIVQASAPAARVTDEAVAQSQTVLAPAQLTAFREIQAEQNASLRAAQLVAQIFPADADLPVFGVPLLIQ